MKLTHKFVKTIPEVLENNVLYVSVEYATAIHKCCCGCGSEIVTPLSPTDWSMTFDGKTITLSPSIGNWSLPCQSHYWITNSKIAWAPKLNKETIKCIRNKEAQEKRTYYPKKGWRALLDFFNKQ